MLVNDRLAKFTLIFAGKIGVLFNLSLPNPFDDNRVQPVLYFLLDSVLARLNVDFTLAGSPNFCAAVEM
jgi:hypothetical protein